MKFTVTLYPINCESEVVAEFPSYQQARSYHAELQRQGKRSSIEKIVE